MRGSAGCAVRAVISDASSREWCRESEIGTRALPCFPLDSPEVGRWNRESAAQQQALVLSAQPLITPRQPRHLSRFRLPVPEPLPMPVLFFGAGRGLSGVL